MAQLCALLQAASRCGLLTCGTQWYAAQYTQLQACHMIEYLIFHLQPKLTTLHSHSQRVCNVLAQ